MTDENSATAAAPFYGLERLAARPDAHVIVTDGADAADVLRAATEMAPTGWARVVLPE